MFQNGHESSSFRHFYVLKSFGIFMTSCYRFTHGKIIHMVKLKIFKICFKSTADMKVVSLTFLPKGCLGRLCTMLCNAATTWLKRDLLMSMASSEPFKSSYSFSIFLSSNPRAFFLLARGQHMTDISFDEKCSRTQNYKTK